MRGDASSEMPETARKKRRLLLQKEQNLLYDFIILKIDSVCVFLAM